MVLLQDDVDWCNETAFKTRARDVKQESIIVSPEFGIDPEEAGITTYSSLALLEAINLRMLLSKYWHEPHVRSGGLQWNIIVLKSSFPRLSFFISVAISCKTKQKYRWRTFYVLACNCTISNSPSTCSFCSVICYASLMPAVKHGIFFPGFCGKRLLMCISKSILEAVIIQLFTVCSSHLVLIINIQFLYVNQGWVCSTKYKWVNLKFAKWKYFWKLYKYSWYQHWHLT